MELFLHPDIRRKILEEITPSEDEVKNQKDVIRDIVKHLKIKGEELGEKYSFIEAHGSTGDKQTQLRGTSDIDIFVGLNPEEYQMILKLPTDQRFDAIDQIMESFIDKWFKPTVAELNVSKVVKSYSQHPYLNLRVKGLDVDILGCFDLDRDTLARDGPITAVDRTVHHTRYVVSKLTDKMRDDVRILKSFVRACHAYGDKCAVGRMGFTGYSLELLLLSHQGLESAFQSLHDLDRIPIDPLKRSLEELKRIEAFRDDDVFIIDPTDHSRNAAASFSQRSYKWIRLRIEHLRKLIETESWDQVLDILIESPIPTDSIPEQIRTHSLAYEFHNDSSVHYTILRDKLHRLAKKISNKLEKERTGEKRFGKNLFEVVFDDNHFALGFLIELPQISDFYFRKGPPIHLHKAVLLFKKEHPDAFEKDGFMWAEEQRRWRHPDSLVKGMINKNRIHGLTYQETHGPFSSAVLNTLYQYILPIEPEFTLSMTQEFKDNN